MRATVLLLAAILAGLVAVGVVVVDATTPISPQYYPPKTAFCPRCASGTAQDCIRTTRNGGTFTCQACANSTNPLRMTQCVDTLFTTSSQFCTSVLTSTAHCGACGASCALITGSAGTGSTCVDGVCKCSPQSCASVNGWCDSSSGNCTKCEYPMAHCAASVLDGGNSTDCRTNLSNNFGNCGACSRSCSAQNSDSCTNGVCTCGTHAKCGGATPYCYMGECRACTPSSPCSVYATPDNGDGYCDTTGSAYTCSKCPAGMGDCTAFQIGGGVDAGVANDCETDLRSTGKVARCGSCTASLVGTHDGLTCCSGVAKCGVYVNASAPTTDECAAAVACGTDKYCDENTKSCIALPSFQSANRRCQGNAADSSDSSLLSSGTGFCGSCNETISKSNIITVISNVTGVDVETQVCTKFSSSNCGKAGNVCKTNTACFNGQCICGTDEDDWFAYNPFQAIDPEFPDVAVLNKHLPAEGCTPAHPINTLKSNFAQRAGMYLNSFLDCAAAAQITTQVTFAGDFANATRRGEICSGDLNRCNATFCADLYTKSMKLKDNGMCESFEAFGEWYAECAMEYRETATASKDPTCRDVGIYNVYNGLPSKSVSFADAALFLGCPQAKNVAGYASFRLPVPFNQDDLVASRYAMVSALLGSASTAVASLVSLATVVVATVYVL